MLQRGANKIRFFPVQQRDAATLLPIISANIAPGTLIVSDGWAAFGGIRNLQQQYDHQWVNHRLFCRPSKPASAYSLKTFIHLAH